ncbi:oligopeptide ABC transporter ATP-binding protein OppD1 [Butyrivibrio proteoclasticus B316]|uniref:Oligopeptide ABC transporter ATP-binding protein OppD1 n=1 Tax=Butyrivibrio proteoclasticus (strain ATCC 51982 / DSM 14932 / B316) TaxID=515622 RepID=E0S2Q0_BUTPB|nr:oligopeptide/dipeptide ABC transporter ATP-binding protein [Butyrivibrio proteoclasticus]ADL34017.1 oligopeptide ABC transporter ATP-binding protein OppD1 [Butyrivibrio proteoclasticus B316]
MEDKKVLLSVKDLEVKFRVRGRILTAIRGISLDIYENESIAIVGESGSGKSVFTKTFAGMLETNGFISNGDIIFNDEELSNTIVTLNASGKRELARIIDKLNTYSALESGADTYRQILDLESEKRAKETLSDEQDEEFNNKINDLKFKKTEEFNLKQTYDTKKEKDKIKESERKIKAFEDEIAKIQKERNDLIQKHKEEVSSDATYLNEYEKKLAALKAQYKLDISKPITKEQMDRNSVLGKEIYLSVGRFKYTTRRKYVSRILNDFKKALKLGENIADEETKIKIFDNVMYCKLVDEAETKLSGKIFINLARVTDPSDWGQTRGKKIATVFQDPMTSLNPIITIGKQISSIIMKHQNVSEVEARARAIEIMKKVGIPNAEKRYDDYPFQYSGGMRQRIVIAIALSCQPKILICDEPTTALDVTIQAQILQLLKDLQKEYNYTIVFITHDLGVVANIADRVAVIYGGQIVELGTVEDVFYDSRHPYTWALLSSLPQLAQKDTELYSITGTPPSLYNKITGDAFAPRNPYCLKIDTIEEPPMFKVSDTHYAKTWLLDPRAPKIEKPEIIRDIHEKFMKIYNITEVSENA